MASFRYISWLRELPLTSVIQKCRGKKILIDNFVADESELELINLHQKIEISSRFGVETTGRRSITVVRQNQPFLFAKKGIVFGSISIGDLDSSNESWGTVLKNERC